MYLLKHKDDTVAVIEIFGSDASCIRVNDIVNHLLPLCAQHDISNIEHWWKRRAVPAYRPGIRQLLSERHIASVHQFLLENLALSVTDCYWICPQSCNISWDSVSCHKNEFKDDLPFSSTGNSSDVFA